MKAIYTTLFILFVALSSFLLFATSCGTQKHLDSSASWKRIAKLEHIEAIEIYVDTMSIERTGSTIIAHEKKVYTSAQSREDYYNSIWSKYNQMGKPNKAEKWLNVNYTIQ